MAPYSLLVSRSLFLVSVTIHWRKKWEITATATYLCENIVVFSVEFYFKMNWCLFHQLINRFCIFQRFLSECWGPPRRETIQVLSFCEKTPKADCREMCQSSSCCQHRAFVSMRCLAFWMWREDVLIKFCGAINSRGDLVRGSVEEDTRCLRPKKTVTCFVWSGWTVSFLLLVCGCRQFGVLTGIWLTEVL